MELLKGEWKKLCETLMFVHLKLITDSACHRWEGGSLLEKILGSKSSLGSLEIGEAGGILMVTVFDSTFGEVLVVCLGMRSPHAMATLKKAPFSYKLYNGEVIQLMSKVRASRYRSSRTASVFFRVPSGPHFSSKCSRGGTALLANAQLRHPSPWASSKGPRRAETHQLFFLVRKKNKNR